MGTRDELASLVTLLDATGARPLIDRDAADGRRPATASPRWPRATSSARSSSPADDGTHLVTGAGSGIGAVLARPARTSAATTSCCWPARPSAADDLRGRRCRARPSCVADLADAGRGRRRWPTSCPTGSTRVVHAAGVVDLGPVADLSTADLAASSSTSTCVAPAVLTRLCLPALRAARGTVVFVNSGAGLSRQPEWSAYAASKFGLRALADSLRARGAGARRPRHHRLPRPHRHADAAEGARAGGQRVRRVDVDPPDDRRRRDPARARPAGTTRRSATSDPPALALRGPRTWGVGGQAGSSRKTRSRRSVIRCWYSRYPP